MKKLITIFILGISMFCHAQESLRIITAGSAITEIVCALGEGSKIVASDKTSLYPDYIQKLPSIGYRSGINAEGILSLKPTIVIAEKNYVEEVVLQQLTTAGIALVVIDRKLNVEDTKKMILQIGKSLNRNDQAAKLVASIETNLKEAQQMLANKSTEPKVLCVYNRGTATISAAGAETFAEILKYTGAKNAIQNIDGYKPLNTESLIQANPDYILMLTSGLESLGGVDGVLKVQGVALTKAGKQKQIVSVDGLKLTNFGPRFGEAVKEVIILLHPELAAK
ncbi:heme/hemin ABC transporter substrate-binding protein [Pseudochryseolinea flava]|uniref:Hemin ABC transporter substrate-binding protein n=1 Tax=Pseudochryseolinea flava TaxID=2059302 RepID=A0A364Y695_9BACT|nr:ABC transporter substrate-binding protein [Pseudochryseolinea flava]RAW02362.1 hemin ABC transporter substrate-binding protein [Pseudochryseolinea flava]